MSHLNMTRVIFEIIFWLGLAMIIAGFNGVFDNGFYIMAIGGILTIIGLCGKCGKPLLIQD